MNNQRGPLLTLFVTLSCLSLMAMIICSSAWADNSDTLAFIVGQETAQRVANSCYKGEARKNVDCIFYLDEPTGYAIHGPTGYAGDSGETGTLNWHGSATVFSGTKPITLYLMEPGMAGIASDTLTMTLQSALHGYEFLSFTFTSKDTKVPNNTDPSLEIPESGDKDYPRIRTGTFGGQDQRQYTINGYIDVTNKFFNSSDEAGSPPFKILLASDLEPTTTPEPGTLLLLASGLSVGGLGGFIRKRLAQRRLPGRH